MFFRFSFEKPQRLHASSTDHACMELVSLMTIQHLKPRPTPNYDRFAEAFPEVNRPGTSVFDVADLAIKRIHKALDKAKVTPPARTP